MTHISARACPVDDGDGACERTAFAWAEDDGQRVPACSKHWFRWHRHGNVHHVSPPSGWHVNGTPPITTRPKVFTAKVSTNVSASMKGRMHLAAARQGMSAYRWLRAVIEKALAEQGLGVGDE